METVTGGEGGISCAKISEFVLCCVVCVQFGVAGLIAQVLKVQTAVTLWRLSLVERVELVVPR